MFTLSIQVSHLAAALCIAPAKDIRYYLNGVFLDAKSCNVVSTDGYVMFCTKPDTVLAEGNSQHDVILPAQFVADVVKANKHNHVVLITIDGTECRTLTHIGKLSDGKFPDWRRIYPRRLAGKAGVQFDKELLARVSKANKALGSKFAGRYPVWTDDEHSAAVAVLANGEAHAIIMPIGETDHSKFAEFVPFAV